MTGSKTNRRIGKIWAVAAVAVGIAGSSASAQCLASNPITLAPNVATDDYVFLGTYDRRATMPDALWFWETCLQLNSALESGTGKDTMPQFDQSVVARRTPNGIFVYMISSSGLSIWQYSALPAGTFTYISSIPVAGFWLVVNSDASFAYIGNHQVTAGAANFDHVATIDLRNLTNIQEAPGSPTLIATACAPSAGGFDVTPQQDWLVVSPYGGSLAANCVTMFPINSTGVPQTTGAVTISTGTDLAQGPNRVEPTRGRFNYFNSLDSSFNQQLGVIDLRNPLGPSYTAIPVSGTSPSYLDFDTAGDRVYWTSSGGVNSPYLVYLDYASTFGSSSPVYPYAGFYYSSRSLAISSANGRLYMTVEGGIYVGNLPALNMMPPAAWLSTAPSLTVPLSFPYPDPAAPYAAVAVPNLLQVNFQAVPASTGPQPGPVLTTNPSGPSGPAGPAGNSDSLYLPSGSQPQATVTTPQTPATPPTTGPQWTFTGWQKSPNTCPVTGTPFAAGTTVTTDPLTNTGDTYYACFTTSYYLTVNITGACTVSPSSGWFLDQSTVQLTTTPLTGWSVDASSPTQVTINGGPATANVICNQTGVSVTVVTNPVTTPPINVTAGSTNGPAPQTGLASTTGATSVMASQSALVGGIGYVFRNWTPATVVPNTVNNATTGSIVTVNTTVTANYYVACVVVTVNPVPANGGTITLSPASGGLAQFPSNCYPPQTVITATETPANGYTFSNWSDDASGTSSTTTVVALNKPLTVTGNFVTGTATSCVAPPPGMIAWYTLDQTNPPSLDSAPGLLGPHSNALWYGGPTSSIITGEVGPGMSFGANQYIQAIDSTEGDIFENDFSIDAWIKLAPGSGSGVLTFLDKRQAPFAPGYSFYVYNHKLGFQLADSSGYTNYNSQDYSSAPIVDDGNWHLVAVTISRLSKTGLQMWVDGSPAGGTFSPTDHTLTLNNSGFLRIGGGLSGDFLGDVDEVEIFNRVLLQSEIQGIFNAGTAGKCKTPLPATVPIIVTTSPLVGLKVQSTSPAASGVSPLNTTWIAGSTANSVSTSSPQPDSLGTTYYQLTNWSGGPSTLSWSPITAPATATTYTANFTPLCYVLTLTSMPTLAAGTATLNPASGGVAGAPSNCYLPNTVVTMTAQSGTGYTFNSFGGDAPPTSAGTDTVTMNGPKNVKLFFDPIVYEQVTIATKPTNLSFTVSLVNCGNANSGNTMPFSSPVTQSWAANALHCLTTTSPQQSGSTYYNFSGWFLNNNTVSQTSSLSYDAMTGLPALFTAVFTPACYLVTVNSNPTNGGAVTLNPASGGVTGAPSNCYAPGTVVTLTETPATGFTFQNWTGGATGSGSTTTITVNAPANVIANFVVQQAAACYAPPSNMIAWYTLDETTSPSLDIAAGGPHISAAWFGGPTSLAAAEVGPGMHFGAKQYIQAVLPAEGDISTSDFSIDAWIRLPSGSATGVLTFLDKRLTSPNVLGYSFYVYDHTLGFQLADATGYTNYGSGSTAPIVDDGKWHLVAATVSRSGNLQMWVDGVASGPAFSVTAHSGSLSNTGLLRIGGGLSGDFLGDVDEVEIFNRVLQLSEIQGILNAGSAGKCKTPLPPVIDYVATNPLGLTVTINGGGPIVVAALQPESWTPGAPQTLATTSPQYNSFHDTQYTFINWTAATKSPAPFPSPSLSVTFPAPTTATTYTANFSTAYKVTLVLNNCGGQGNVSGLTTTNPVFVAAGSTVLFNAAGNPGYSLQNLVASPSTNATVTYGNGVGAMTINPLAGPVTITATCAPPNLNFGGANWGDAPSGPPNFQINGKIGNNGTDYNNIMVTKVVWTDAAGSSTITDTTVTTAPLPISIGNLAGGALSSTITLTSTMPNTVTQFKVCVSGTAVSPLTGQPVNWTDTQNCNHVFPK